MNTKHLVFGTIVGGVTLFLVGYIIFDLAAGDFYAANLNTAPGIMRETQILWAIALGNLVLGLLLTVGITSRTGAHTTASGAITGAVIACLAWLSADLVLYGYLDVFSPTLVIVDPLLELVHGGIAGAVIVAVLARIPKGAEA
jgi:hypothetical protein